MGIERVLQRAEVFLGLDDSDITKIAELPSCREVSYRPGEFIFRVGNEAKYLYVLKEGRVDLTMEGPPIFEQESTEVSVDRITMGDFFGWSALVGPHFYTSSAICREASEVVVISGVELIALFEKDYQIGYRVYQSLARIIGTRLRGTVQVLLRGHSWPFLGEQNTFTA